MPMTVIDIRNVFSDRQIEIIDINPSYIYYFEEKNEEGRNELFLLEYNRKTRKERLVMNYTLDDPTYMEHIYSFDKTIVMVLENGSNSFWLIEIDKKTGGELNRRKVVCTGAFRECKPLDSEYLLIYMGPDEANAEVFSKYKEIKGCDCLCYLYNIKTNQKYLVNAAMINRIGGDNIKPITVESLPYLLLLDPFAEESVKEHYYSEQRWVSADIRDNIWLSKTSEVEMDIEDGKEAVTRKCIASADIKALVRYMGMDDHKVYFRAKEFRSGTEKICSYDITTEALQIEATPSGFNNDTFYMIEEKPFKMFAVTVSKNKTTVVGLINSEARIVYDNTLGQFMTCIDNRYCVTKKTVFSEESQREFTYFYLYDAHLEQYESYECNCLVKGDTLVLY